MKIHGEQRFGYPRQAVWEALMDPEVLAGTLPGCERLERAGEETFEGRLRVNVGPVRGDFRGRLVMTERVPPESYRMQLDGRGPNGFMTGEGTIRLQEEDAGTVLSYDLEAQVGGKIAGLGQRLLERTGKAVAQQGLEGLERQLAALQASGAASPSQRAAAAKAASGPSAGGSGRPAAVAAQPGTAAASSSPSARTPGRPLAAPPSQVDFAAGVARQVLADLVPPESRRFVLAGGCFVTGLLLGFWLGGRRR